MASSNYVRGRRFEYRTRNKLLDMGAVYVMRAAQSKGAADLAAFWPRTMDYDGNGIHYFSREHPWLVQCKTGTARMSRQAKDDLVALAKKAGAYAYLAEPGKNGRGVQFTLLPGENIGRSG